jgi:hypothetical protein
MKHHVTCVICGKKDYIPIDPLFVGKGGWFYGGKPNLNLNPNGKPSRAEYWECPKCAANGS